MSRLSLLICCAFLFGCQPKKKDVKVQKAEKQDSIEKASIPESHSLIPIFESLDYLVLAKEPKEIMVTKRERANDSFPIYNQLAGYGEDIIMGKDLSFEDVTIYRKYGPNSTFEDYPVDVYQGELAEPDFATNPAAKQFITRITEGCANGVNFSGHYTFVSWGCGSPCQTGVVVDRITGKIFDGPVTSLGSEFREDSKLLIKNIGALDKKTNLIEVCSYCEVTHEVWNGNSFETVYK